jgi:hypothetical protein
MWPTQHLNTAAIDRPSRSLMDFLEDASPPGEI